MAKKATDMETNEVSENVRGTSRILINKNFTLCRDSYSMWIEELKTVTSKDKKTEKEVWQRVAGYSGSFEGLIISFTRNKVLGLEAENVEEFLSQMDRLQKETIKLATDIVKKVKTNAR